MPSPRHLCLSLALILAAPVAAADDPRFVRGRDTWLARDYVPSQAALLAYRPLVYGRNAVVDYMLGTGACRIDGARERGRNMLSFTLYHYALTPPSRLTIEREYALCRGAAAMPAMSAEGIKVAVLPAAGSAARGKMYYSIDSKQPVVAYPARPLGEVDRAEIAARLVPLGQPAVIAAKLRAANPAARVFVDGPFAFVTTAGQTDAQLAGMAKLLSRYLGFLEREYGIRPPPNYLTIYLVKYPEDVRTVARKLHKLDVSRATLAYTYQDDQTAVSLSNGILVGTLLHELFHLVVRTSFGDIPQWLDEGMAALYEVSAFRDGRVTGLPNWRGPVLARLWQQRPTIAEVVTSPWFTADTASAEMSGDVPSQSTEAITAQFAVARYFALYLEQKGKLRPVYNGIKALDPFASPDPAAAALAVVTGAMGPIDALQADFDRWFLAGVEPRRTAATRPPRCDRNAAANAPQQQQQQIPC